MVSIKSSGMVAERHLVAAVPRGGGHQRAFAHLGAERAGVGFFPDVEHHFADLGAFEDKGHVQPAAEFFQRGKVVIAEAEIDRNGRKIEFFGGKLSVFGEQFQQRNAVFSARKPHGYPVAVAYEFVFVYPAAETRQHLLRSHNLHLFV